MFPAFTREYVSRVDEELITQIAGRRRPFWHLRDALGEGHP